jgi:uncharacterized protein YkwD
MARAVVALFIMLASGGAASAQVASNRSRRAPLAEPRKALTERVSAVADLEDQVFRAVNAQRARRGLALLRVNRQLALVARGPLDVDGRARILRPRGV